jgi:antitoxin MazE
MRVQIQKWGNSLALRIPKPFAEEAEVKEGTSVDLSLVEGALVAVPDVKGRYTLKQLLSKVTKANLHKEVSFGSAVGREGW